MQLCCSRNDTRISHLLENKLTKSAGKITTFNYTRKGVDYIIDVGVNFAVMVNGQYAGDLRNFLEMAGIPTRAFRAMYSFIEGELTSPTKIFGSSKERADIVEIHRLIGLLLEYRKAKKRKITQSHVTERALRAQGKSTVPNDAVYDADEVLTKELINGKDVVVYHTPGFNISIDGSEPVPLTNFQAAKEIATAYLKTLCARLHEHLERTTQEDAVHETQVALHDVLTSLLAYRGATNLLNAATEIIDNLEVMEEKDGALFPGSNLGYTEVTMEEGVFNVLHVEEGKRKDFKTTSVQDMLRDVAVTWHASKAFD